VNRTETQNIIKQTQIGGRNLETQNNTHQTHTKHTTNNRLTSYALLNTTHASIARDVWLLVLVLWVWGRILKVFYLLVEPQSPPTISQSTTILLTTLGRLLTRLIVFGVATVQLVVENIMRSSDHYYIKQCDSSERRRGGRSYSRCPGHITCSSGMCLLLLGVLHEGGCGRNNKCSDTNHKTNIQ
jgi:hypothetical protein